MYAIFFIYHTGSYNQDDIEGAAKAANVHNFIMSLPDQYDTQVCMDAMYGWIDGWMYAVYVCY